MHYFHGDCRKCTEKIAGDLVRAFQEFVEENGIKYEYIGYCRKGQHVAVKIV